MSNSDQRDHQNTNQENKLPEDELRRELDKDKTVKDSNPEQDSNDNFDSGE